MLRIANRSSDIVAALLEKHQVAILEFTQDEEQGILENFVAFRMSAWSKDTSAALNMAF